MKKQPNIRTKRSPANTGRVTTRFDNLQVTNLLEKETHDLGALADRSMKVQVNIQDGEVMVSVEDTIVYVTPVAWKSFG